MAKTAIISVDGHVKASRSGYRDYIQNKHLEAYDESVKAAEEEGIPDAGNLNPEYGFDAQWDSKARWETLEGQGVVAEVLFPNGQPFQVNRFEDVGRAANPELEAEGRRAYNRWLADFCAETPGRRAGQALVSFDDIDQAVNDVFWAREHGLGGIMMPALDPGGIFFFDPALDPVWAACEETGLPISQHGGAGTPAYDPPGFAALMTLALEHSFFSGRSLWQMILGGVFERFPHLRVVFVETEADWIAPVIRKLDRRLGWGDDWMGFSRHIQRHRDFTRPASEYWASNCYAGVSPFSTLQVPLDELALGGGSDGFCISAERAMFGVDYPHFESIFPRTEEHVAEMVAHPSISETATRRILYENAAEVYRFDLERLQADIDRVGFELGDGQPGAPACGDRFL
jgi:predicted TIM-barrel fold metal-dependent hydrolase